MSSARGRDVGNRQRDFRQLHEQHQLVNRQNKIKGFDKRKASAPFLVVLQGLKDLSLKDTKFGRERLGEVGQMQAP